MFNFVLMQYIEHDKRPWGEYFVLDEGDSFKVKRIIVNPGERLSYQYHHKRAEVWTIVSGIGTVTLDDVVRDYNVGEVIEIKQGSKHRIENKQNVPCIFIEVQYGSYFGEDDIVRLEDDYDRA